MNLWWIVQVLLDFTGTSPSGTLLDIPGFVLKSWETVNEILTCRHGRYDHDHANCRPNIWIKKAKQHCCCPFSYLLSFASFMFAELTLSNLATAKVGGASAGQATAHRVSAFLLISCTYAYNEHHWRSMTIPTLIELRRWHFPVSFQITNRLKSEDESIDRTNHVTCPSILHIPVRQPILMCCLAWDWNMMKLWNIRH